MIRPKRHPLQQLERPHRHSMLFLIAATVGLLNVAATVMTLLATGPTF